MKLTPEYTFECRAPNLDDTNNTRQKAKITFNPLVQYCPNLLKGSSINDATQFMNCLKSHNSQL